MDFREQSHVGCRRWAFSGSSWESDYGYARAVRVAEHIYVAGTTAMNPDGTVVGANNAYLQTQYIISIITEALRDLGASLNDVVRTRMYVVNIHQNADSVGKAHAEAFETIRPAATMVEVAGLITPELLVEIEVDAVLT